MAANDRTVCPHCGNGLTYTVDGHTYYRTILVEVQGVYDGGLFYRCPDCQGQWHRWPKMHPLRTIAEGYMQ